MLLSLLAAGSATADTTVYRYRDANGVVSFTDQAVRGATVLVFHDRMVENLDPLVKLETRKHGAGESLWLRNDLFAPVEVELRLERLGNIAGRPVQLIRRVLPARSNTSLLSLQPADASKPLRYAPKLRFALGDPRRQPYAFRYPLPWQGGPFRLSQGANGKYSHYTPKGRHAVDIAMPEGTPIIASRAGTVVKTENRQSGRGSNPSGNFVRILHEDGTMGVYLHLHRGSIGVREGQRVAAGTLIARSGNTGNSTGPHLHFVVQRNVGLALESIPFEFAQPVDAMPRPTVMGGE